MEEFKRRQTFLLLPERLYGTPKYNLLSDYVRNTQWLSQLVMDANTPHVKQYLDGDGYKSKLDECTHIVIFFEHSANIEYALDHHNKQKDYVRYGLENGLRVFMIKPSDFSFEEITK
jgi:hypothetical protein